MKMADLQRMVQQNGTFKADLMQAFLQAAQVSFREHQRNHGNATQQQPGFTTQTSIESTKNPADINSGSNITSGEKISVNGKLQNGNESGYSSLSSPASSKSHSPLSNNDNAQSASDFVYQNSQHHLVDSKGKLTVDGMSGYNHSNISAAASQRSESHDSIIDEIEHIAMNIKPEPGLSSTQCAMESSGSKDFKLEGADAAMSNLPPEMMHVVSAMMPGIQPGMELTAEALTEMTEKMFDPAVMDQFSFSPVDPGLDSESNSPCSSVMAKMILSGGGSVPMDGDEEDAYMSIDAVKILDDVKQIPSEIRRTLIDQVTESVVEAHFSTCNPTYQNVSEANERLQLKIDNGEMVSVQIACLSSKFPPKDFI